MSNGARATHLADAVALEYWADRIEARSDFPKLIRRLIHQTNDQVTDIEMRGGEGTGYAGYDGRVEASRGTPLVPAGLSVWELGTGDSLPGKANKDYATRTADSLGVEKSTATFVFATPRRWSGKGEWAEAKRAEGVWADVRAFDADDIETAFAVAHAAHFWFSELIGLPVDGLQMIEGWWDAFSRVSQPALTPTLVLAGRADAAADLLRLLEEETRLTTISAPSTDDVLAFVASTLLSTPHPDLVARTMIVYDAATLRRLDAATDLLILLPFEDDLRRQAQLVQSHHVILMLPGDMPADIALQPIDRAFFRDSLIEQGTDREVAEQLAEAAHRGVVAFQAEAPSRFAPIREWSSAFASRVVRRAWLAGGWQEARTGDREALESFFGVSYDDARSDLHGFVSGRDPIFTTVGGTWGLTSTEDALQFAGMQLDRGDLVALEAAVQSVLGAVDPALELPVDERWLAAVRGKTRIHSSDLRRGLATTLALFGAHGTSLDIGAVGPLPDWAASVVAQLLHRANEDTSGDLWVSLADVLPSLAEAAPDAFLRAVQEGVQATSEPILARMFADAEADTLSVSSPHTGLLWALETLAWSPEHAPLACQLLARLSQIDPGGKLSNRPLNSLADIFRPWLPQTSLSSERRIAVLDALRRDHPAVAWKLMLMLLPEHHAVGMYSHAPRFRDWKPDEVVVTYGEIWQFSTAVAERLLNDVDDSPERWLDIIERIALFPPRERSAAAERLAALADSEEFSAELREQLWRELDELIRKHRSFASADWALPPEELEQLEAASERLRPADPIGSNVWLFDQHLPDLGDERLDFHEQERRTKVARSSAVRAVLESEGVPGVFRLARSSKYPWSVGLAAASRSSPGLDEAVLQLLDSEDGKLVALASGYALDRVRAEGLNWLRDRLAELAGRPVAEARLLHATDDLETAWAIANELGDQVEEAYWREFRPHGRGHDFQLVNDAAETLMRFRRPITALDLMSLYVRAEDRRVSPELVFEGLQMLVHLDQEHDEESRLSSYELESLLNYLRDCDFDEERLGLLEWQLRPALGFQARSPVLERRLARDPVFFVHLLSLVYRSDADEGAETAPDHIARNAYRLLDEWKIIPGAVEQYGVVDETQLREWIEEARRLASEAGRSEVGDMHIGKVFAHARSDEDGSWPTRPVRDAIERLASSHLEDGLGTQTYNNRGPTTRGLLDGGEQERALAQRYDELAAQIRDGWPRTAAILSSLARGYEREARRHDEEVERFRQGMDR